jgi:hypothetical protein
MLTANCVKSRSGRGSGSGSGSTSGVIQDQEDGQGWSSGHLQSSGREDTALQLPKGLDPVLEPPKLRLSGISNVAGSTCPERPSMRR